MQKLNNTLLKSDWVKEDIKGEIKRHVQTDENDNTTYKNFCDAVKAVARGKFILLQDYLKKQQKFQINYLTLHFKDLEREDQRQLKIRKKRNDKNESRIE